MTITLIHSCVANVWMTYQLQLATPFSASSLCRMNGAILPWASTLPNIHQCILLVPVPTADDWFKSYSVNHAINPNSRERKWQNKKVFSRVLPKAKVISKHNKSLQRVLWSNISTLPTVQAATAALAYAFRKRFVRSSAIIQALLCLLLLTTRCFCNIRVISFLSQSLLLLLFLQHENMHKCTCLWHITYFLLGPLTQGKHSPAGCHPDRREGFLFGCWFCF